MSGEGHSTPRSVPGSVSGVKSFLSLLFAILILVAFGGLAFFFLNISSGAKFERRDKQTEAPVTNSE